MAFNKEQTRTPVAIADIAVELFSPDPASVETASASYSVQVRYDTDEVRVLTGDLAPHLTAAQINQLVAFMGMLRNKAIAEILP